MVLANEVWRGAECVSSFTVASFMRDTRDVYIYNIHIYFAMYINNI